VQLYFSLAAEVINYWTWKTLANTIPQNRQRINKIHRAFTALKRIIIEDLKRCRAREWELNGASCCFTDSFRAIWNYILITFLFFWAGKSQEIVLLLTFWGCQLVMFKWFGGNWFELRLILDFEDAISIGWRQVLMGEWLWRLRGIHKKMNRWGKYWELSSIFLSQLNLLTSRVVWKASSIPDIPQLPSSTHSLLSLNLSPARWKIDYSAMRLYANLDKRFACFIISLARSRYEVWKD
jgi:hypothetical protein